MKEWAQFIDEQKVVFGAETVEKWLKPLKIVRFDACNLYLQAQNSFQSLWFDEHIRQKLSAFVNSNQKKINIHLELAGEKTKPKQKKSKNTEPAYPIHFDNLDPFATFDTFTVHDENLVAYRFLDETSEAYVQHALKTLSSFSQNTPEALQGVINPILLYGPSGCGKTHLLQALCQKLKRVGYNVVYTTAETFTDHVVKAIRASNMAPFRHIYRTLDVLVVDDIQNFAKKNATQEEFFHTFNALHTANKLIVLGSATAPNLLQNIEPRLISRFEWGISLPMSHLPKKELVKVICNRARSLQYPLTTAICEFLTETFSSSSKSCMKALDALILRSHLAKKTVQKMGGQSTVSPTVIKEMLQDLIDSEQKQRRTCEDITKHVATYFGMPVSDLTGKSQARECVVARQLAMLLCRELLKIPYMKIADFFHRDHSTVLSGIKQIQKQMGEKNSDILLAYNKVTLEMR